MALGLLSVAFDSQGREILDALAERPGMPRAHVHCCHAIEDDAGGGTVWFCRTPASGWETATWAPPNGTFQTGLEAVVRSALDLERWQTPEGGLDLLDLVLVSPSPEPAAGRLPAAVIPALQSLRRRFRLIGRILLLADGRFETCGEAAPRSLLQTLPFAGRSDAGVFDLIVLLDRINLEGMVINDDQDARAHAASILAHLTIGELAPILYRRVQSEQARLGEEGRYLTLGLAEWRLTRNSAVSATSALLYRRMAGRLLADSAPAAENPETIADTWPGEVAEQVLEEPPQGKPFPKEDLQAMATRHEGSGYDSLRSALRGAGWHLRSLETLVHRRLEALRSVETRTTLKLARFMDRKFARWYVDYQLGRAQGTPASVMVSKEPMLGKKVLFALACLLCLAGVGAAVETSYTLASAVAAAGSGLAAILMFISGFNRQISIPISGSSAPDLMPELRFRRGRNWVAKRLVLRHEEALKSWQQSRQRLQEDTAAAGDEPIPFPFTTEVCASLLVEKSVDDVECLQRFWEEEPAALRGVLGKAGRTLPELLQEFSAACCEPFASLEWSDLFRVIGGEKGLEDPAWRDALEKARSGALPWLPVAGSSLQTFLALPRSLPPDLSRALSRQFPDQKVVEEIDGSKILVLQLSQGYRVPVA